MHLSVCIVCVCSVVCKMYVHMVHVVWHIVFGAWYACFARGIHVGMMCVHMGFVSLCVYMWYKVFCVMYM